MWKVLLIASLPAANGKFYYRTAHLIPGTARPRRADLHSVQGSMSHLPDAFSSMARFQMPSPTDLQTRWYVLLRNSMTKSRTGSSNVKMLVSCRSAGWISAMYVKELILYYRKSPSEGSFPVFFLIKKNYFDDVCNCVNWPDTYNYISISKF